MLYPKTIKRHLLGGGGIEDWLEGEPGRCNNGGRYYIIYHIISGKLMYRSSYEDDEWKEVEESLDEFVEFVRKTWNDRPYFVDNNRWVLV